MFASGPFCGATWISWSAAAAEAFEAQDATSLLEPERRAGGEAVRAGLSEGARHRDAGVVDEEVLVTGVALEERRVPSRRGDVDLVAEVMSGRRLLRRLQIACARLVAVAIEAVRLPERPRVDRRVLHGRTRALTRRERAERHARRENDSE